MHAETNQDIEVESRAAVRADGVPPFVAASHVVGEMPPVLELVVARVTMACELRHAWLAHLASHDGRRSATDEPAAQGAFVATASALADTRRELEDVERRLASSEGEALRHVREVFALSAAEADLLQLALARCAAPHLGGIFGGLTGEGSRYATPHLAARLFDHPRPTLWQATSPLCSWGLLEPMGAAAAESMPLSCEPTLMGYLAGPRSPLDELGGACALLPDDVRALESWPADDAQKRVLGQRGAVTVVVRGAPGSGRRTFAACVSAELGERTLAIDTDGVDAEQWPSLHRATLRVCRLYQLVPVWLGSRAGEAHPRGLPPCPLAWRVLDPDAAAPEDAGVEFDLPAPGRDDRERLWQELVPTFEFLSDDDRREVIDDLALSPGAIRQMGEAQPLDAATAVALHRAQARRPLEELGHVMDTPFQRQDLMGSEALQTLLGELLYEAESRRSFWAGTGARSLFPRGRGVTALFHGHPGTGKTMAAQIVARELGIDLVRVDLASLIDKYVGQTAKNLRLLFERAAAVDAVLFFDEADALFSRRTAVKDSQDRHANADTGYLLQLLESFEGVVLLATNKLNQLDPAFIRRLRYCIPFLKLDVTQRFQLFARVVLAFTDGPRLRQLEPVLHLLSGVEMSGADIKSAVLNAALFARQRGDQPLGVDDLVLGARRQMEKTGSFPSLRRPLGKLERV